MFELKKHIALLGNWKEEIKDGIKTAISGGVREDELKEDKELIDAKNLAQEIMKKEIPQEGYMKEVEYGDRSLSCPRCKAPIINVWNKKKYEPAYCHYCGQKFKWE